MRAVDIIARKRDGEALSRAEIEFFVHGFACGDIPDYQASAWAMAVLWRGMTPQETVDLTMAMVSSGDTVDLGGIAPVIVDKHSTGGVGDKTTLVVAPLVAAAGLPVVKMSGRGLGFSGGTLDKLESIPGLNVSYSQAEFLRHAREHGVIVAGQTADLVPADGKLYALRDVTATVPSLPLIASSIMSKKIAGGADAIVLDVKLGRGAFMPTLETATDLANMMIEIGRGVGRRVTAVLSDMSQPLGLAVGNALEVREAIATLQGRGPDDLVEHCLAIAAEMLVLGNRADSPEQAREVLGELLTSGRALERFSEWIASQGGDSNVVDDPSLLPRAPVVEPLLSPASGYLAAIDAREVGNTAVELGAGRARKGDAIDPAVGITLVTKVGDQVTAGQPLLHVHARDEASAQSAISRLESAAQLLPSPVAAPPLIYGTIRG